MFQFGLAFSLLYLGCHQLDLYRSIHLILDYALITGEASNAFTFGAFLAKANVDRSKEMAIDAYNRILLDKISIKLDSILNRTHLSMDLNMCKTWTKKAYCPEKLRKIELNYTILNAKFLEHGYPSQLQSDDCIVPLLSGCHQPKYCSKCFSNGLATGYSLLHRALYFSLIDLLDCEADVLLKINTRKKITVFCSQILAEHNQIMKYRHLSHLDDLFIEQVAICGHHSYQEFLSKENLNFILHKSKLFHSLDGQERPLTLLWDSHLGGVSIAALSAFLMQ